MKPINIILISLGLSVFMTLGNLTENIFRISSINIIQSMFRPEEPRYIELSETKDKLFQDSAELVFLVIIQGWAFFLAYRLRKTRLNE